MQDIQINGKKKHTQIARQSEVNFGINCLPYVGNITHTHTHALIPSPKSSRSYFLCNTPIGRRADDQECIKYHKYHQFSTANGIMTFSLLSSPFYVSFPYKHVSKCISLNFCNHEILHIVEHLIYFYRPRNRKKIQPASSIFPI